MTTQKEMKLTGNRCQCAACGEYFNSVYAFEKHRKGKHDVERYCEPPPDVGMVKNKAGFWITAPYTDRNKSA